MAPPEEQQNNSKPWLEPHRFKSGQSGNPNGRPKGSVSLPQAIRRALANDDGKLADALARVGLKKALEGDFRFWKEIKEVLPDEETTPVEADEPLDGVAFPPGSIPALPQQEAIRDCSSGTPIGKDGDGKTEAGRKPDPA